MTSISKLATISLFLLLTGTAVWGRTPLGAQAPFSAGTLVKAPEDGARTWVTRLPVRLRRVHTVDLVRRLRSRGYMIVSANDIVGVEVLRDGTGRPSALRVTTRMVIGPTICLPVVGFRSCHATNQALLSLSGIPAGVYRVLNTGGAPIVFTL